MTTNNYNTTTQRNSNPGNLSVRIARSDLSKIYGLLESLGAAPSINEPKDNGYLVNLEGSPEYLFDTVWSNREYLDVNCQEHDLDDIDWPSSKDEYLVTDSALWHLDSDTETVSAVFLEQPSVEEQASLLSPDNRRIATDGGYAPEQDYEPTMEDVSQTPPDWTNSENPTI